MYFHRVLLLIIPALYMVAPLLIDSWQRLQTSWYIPYFVWLVVIILIFLIEKGHRDV